MRFFHLSDLHIGLKLFNRDLSEDQEYIFRQIADLAGRCRPDAVIIAGDIYDRALPASEAVTLFDGFITALREAVPEAELMMISGNHDSAPRIDLFRGVLERENIHMIGTPPMQPDQHIEKVTLSDEFGEVDFYLLPFVRPSAVRAVIGMDEETRPFGYEESIRRLIVREEIDPDRRSVIVSHQFYIPAGTDPEGIQRMDSETVMVGNIDAVSAGVLAPFDYAALGHIHKPMKVGSEFIRYCGTPLACSVSEAGQQKGVVLVEMGKKGDIRTDVLPLTPLRQVRVIEGELEEILRQACGDYVSIKLTDRRDLDVIDMQDRLRDAFPYLLEIRRTAISGDRREMPLPEEREKDPLALCTSFLQGADEEETALLSDVIAAVQMQTGETV